VLAYAKIFMASAATSLSLAGVVIVAALGQTIRTTAGMSAGSTKFDDDCVVAGVICRGPVGCGMMRARCLLGHRGPGERSYANQGRLVSEKRP
jgi:hypothetical protein